ncbi:MAG: hypothetical protein AAGB31_00195 [Bdellovibrio sp.]
MQYVMILLMALAMPQASFAAWDLNDVSYLMPLPQKLGSDGLLRMNAPGRGGDLLPAPLLARLPLLAMDMSREESYAALRVVAVRIDPCFPLPTPMSCQKQIRLVWQPLEKGPRQKTLAVDAAFHSFYVLTEEEFPKLLADLTQWKEQFKVETASKPLQIHPAWQEEGDHSPALAAFHEIIRKYAGGENLSRVTMMVLRGGGNMWAFAGFDMKNGSLMMVPVPRLDDRRSQAFVNMATPADKFSGGGMSPTPLGQTDVFQDILVDSDGLGSGAEELIRREVRAAFRIENPKNYNPENMDCVSCHVTQPAIRWAVTKRPELKLEELWNSEIYSNHNYNLENISPLRNNTQVIRGLGYFGKDPAVSQRVINESAEVADILNALLK